jgi:trans-aconitate methyltransferase
MLKKNIIRSLSRFNYPQRVFAMKIIGMMNRYKASPDLLIDCPCGNGETSYHFSFAAKQVLAADLSKESIQNARENFARPNVEFKVADIKEIIQSSPMAGVFCLLNSLFLMDNAEDILKLLHGKANRDKSLVFIILPNTKGKNFSWFQSRHPAENKFVIEEHNIKSYFSQRGFNVKTIEPVAFTHHFNRRDVKLFSAFWPLYLGFLNRFQSAFKIGIPNYFLIALTA